MPRKSSKKMGRSRPSQSLRDHSISIPFAAAIPYTGATAYTVALQPVSFTRVLAEADGYELYRFTKLKFRLIDTVNAYLAAAYFPGVTDTAPTSETQICANPQHTFLGVNQTVPSGWVTLGKELRGYEPWYKTIAGTPDPAQEIQGNIFITASSSTVAFHIQIKGVIEFRGPVPTGSTPAMRREAMLKKEYARIMHVLAAGGGGAVLKAPCAPPSG